jgi:hypothetical protein
MKNEYGFGKKDKFPEIFELIRCQWQLWSQLHRKTIFSLLSEGGNQISNVS